MVNFTSPFAKPRGRQRPYSMAAILVGLVLYGGMLIVKIQMSADAGVGLTSASTPALSKTSPARKGRYVHPRRR